MASPESIAEIARRLEAGVQAHERGDLPLAQQHYDAVLKQMPQQADALHLLGVLHDQQGRHAEGIALIRRAIAALPEAAAFHDSLGTALLAAGDRTAAEAAYRQALVLDGNFVQSHVNLARLLIAAKRGEAALPHLATAVQLKPADAALRDLIARTLSGLQRHADAILHHRKAMARAPDDLRFRENYALTLLQQETPASLTEAERELTVVLAQEPERLEALIALGLVLLRQQRPHEARPYLERALAQAPDRVDALVGYSATLAFAGRIAEALAAADKANALSPDDCVVLTHRGMVRDYAGNHDAALVDYDAALKATRRRTPQTVADAEFKLALLKLSLGRLGEGWPLYKARNDIRHNDQRAVAFQALLPEWDGVVRPGQRILVWGEQGIGDQVIYAGMLPELQARGASFAVACDARLAPLFRRSFPMMQIEAMESGSGVGRFAALGDVQIGLGELGRWLRPTLADFPQPRAYLKPDEQRVADLRRRYRAHGKTLVVGIMWRSSNLRLGNFKSIGLADWEPVLQQRDILFVDLQYGDTAEERRLIQSALGVEILHDDEIDALKDIDGFAAQAAAVDLVIGASNSGQHIAAATGRPCWIILPGGLGRLWYWFTGRTDSPWYPHVRLFRQPVGHNENWADTMMQVGIALGERLREHPA